MCTGWQCIIYFQTKKSKGSNSVIHVLLQDREPTDSISLFGCTVKAKSSPQTQKSLIEITSPNRTYNFYADTLVEVKEWIHHIQKQIDAARSGPPPSLPKTEEPPPSDLGVNKEGWVYQKGGSNWSKRYLILKGINLNIQVSPQVRIGDFFVL